MALLASACTNTAVVEESTSSTSSTTSTTTTTTTTEPPPTTTTTTLPPIDWDFVGVADRPVVTLLDPGAEPRQVRGVDLEIGDTRTTVVRNGFSLEQTIDGEAFTSIKTTTATAVTATVLIVDDAGYTLRETFGPTIAFAGDPASTDAVRAAYASVEGTSTYSLISQSGELLATETSGLPEEVADLTQNLVASNLPLPVEPIGVGAVWEVKVSVVVNGTEFLQTSTATLIAANDTTITIEGDVVQSLGATGFALPGFDTKNVEYATIASSIAVWDLTTPGPPVGSATANQVLDATFVVGDQEARFEQTTVMTFETGTNLVDASDGVLRVAFVHVGPVADVGWTWSHDQGAQYLKNQLGDAVEITTLESIAEGPASQGVFEDLAALGNELIFGTSFGYMEPMVAASANYPDTVFMHATGYMVTDNMGNYFGAAEEARYLSGMAAGKATETNLIGYVAAFPIPEVLRGINAFTLGAQEVNPDVTVQVVWTSTWFDPPKEGAATQSLIDAGADVVAMHQDSTAPGTTAEAAGVKWVGYNTDMEEFAPGAWLTAATWDWGPYYLATAQQVIAGTWQSDFFYGNMAGGMVTLAPFGESVDQTTQDTITTRQAEIVGGTFAVFPDPIVNQAGESQPLGDIFIMDYFVEGVVGSPTG
jgi:basic membrane protein A